MSEETKRKRGRPPKSPEGRRATIHVSLSPRAIEVLKTLCRRPIAPIDRSAVLEYLIMERAEQSLSPDRS
jgi:hypothetical protein